MYKTITTTLNFLATTDELTLKTLMAQLPREQVRKVLKTAQRTLINRDPFYNDTLCIGCRTTSVNAEDGETTCGECKAPF